MFSCIYTTFCLSVHQWTFELFPPFGYCAYCCYEHWSTNYLLEPLLSVLLGLYLGVELLDHMIILFF